MSYKQAVKELELSAGAGELIFTVGTGPDKLVANIPHNFFDLVSLDGADGSPVEPGAGTYTTYIERVPNGGFQALSDGGTIDATKTGGTTTADGAVLGGSFGSPINRIKMVAAGITTATHVRMTIQQQLG